MDISELESEEIIMDLVHLIGRELSPGYISSYGPNEIGLWIWQVITLEGSILYHSYEKGPEAWKKVEIASIADPRYRDKVLDVLIKKGYERKCEQL